MSAFVVRRILWLIPTLFCILLITFAIMHATPGGPWDTDAQSRASDPAVQAALDRQFGLDKPLYLNLPAAQAAWANGGNLPAAAVALFDSQFVRYLGNLGRGDLGPSYRYRGRQVQDLLFQPDAGRSFWQNRVVMTLLLGLLAMGIAVLIGMPLGLMAALRQNSALDHLGVLLATIGYGIPSLVMGILLIYVFSVWLDLIPVLDFSYWDSWQPWLLPAFALALPTAAYLARLTRSSVIEVMRQDYVRTARAKGLSEPLVITRHVLGSALVPVITFMGPALAALIAGSFIIESQFGVNGIGVLFVESIGKRDYGVILALTLFYAVLVVLANLIVDIVYGFLDPRIRESRG